MIFQAETQAKNCSIELPPRSPGSERVLLVDAVDLDVEDDETAALLDVCYFIVGGNNDGYFDLFPREHELVVARELGRNLVVLFWTYINET